MNVRVEEAKQRVLKTHPKALVHWIPYDESNPFCIAQIYKDDQSDDPAIGDGDSEDEAWLNADFRLLEGF